jgi:CheY-like chemotaxis protein
VEKVIAFIDDDDVAHLIFKTLLAQYDPFVKVNAYFSAVQALNDVPNLQNVDRIVLDLDMPLMGGWDFLVRLRENGLNIPVYMLTSSDSTVDRQKAKTFEAVKGYFIKPARAEYFPDIFRNLSGVL